MAHSGYVVSRGMDGRSYQNNQFLRQATGAVLSNRASVTHNNVFGVGCDCAIFL